MFKRIAIAALVLTGVSGISLAFQAPQPPTTPGAGPGAGMRRGGRGQVGVITAIAGTTYTIKTMRGTEVKATVPAETPVVKLDKSNGAIADLKVGMFVSVQGQRGTDGTVAATRVTISNPMVAGAIVTVSAKRIAIKAANGKFSTFLVNEKTGFRQGRTDAKATDFKVGDQVMVEYTGALAVNVSTMPAGGNFGGGGARRNPNGGNNAATPPTPPTAPAPAPGQ